MRYDSRTAARYAQLTAPGTRHCVSTVRRRDPTAAWATPSTFTRRPAPGHRSPKPSLSAASARDAGNQINDWLKVDWAPGRI